MRAISEIRPTIVGAALLLLVALLPPVRAQQGGAAPATKPLVPVAASTLADRPEPYYGERVTVTGAVEQILSPTAFLLDQDKTKSTDRTVLILVPTLNAALDLNTYVTAIGEVLRFDPAEIAARFKEYTLHMTPETADRYRGRPAVMATTVLNGAMVDLARRLPPPMTPAEEAFSKVMKRVGPAFAALRKGIEASSADLAREQAVVLRQAFAETEAFWKARGGADAIGWAQDARKQAESIERGVAGGRWDEVKASATELGAACQSCHAQYRERFDDGSYRIKGGSGPEARISR
jgi:cytochrome c556